MNGFEIHLSVGFFFSLKVAHPTLFLFTYCKIKHIFFMENPPVIFT